MENTSLITTPEQTARAVTERIRINGQLAVNAVCEIGKDLRTMKIEKLFLHLGYDSFENYAEQEFGLKRRQAYQYISVYENLGESFVQSNAQLGITKLSLLTQIDNEQRDELMEENDLAGMTVTEIKELVEKVRVQEEQLTLLEEEKAELENRVPKEIIREVPDKKVIEEKDKEITELSKTVARLEKEKKALERKKGDKKSAEENDKKEKEIAKLKEELEQVKADRNEEVERLKEQYESQIAEAKNIDTDKNSFKSIYTSAYKELNGLIEFVRNTQGDNKGAYIERTKALLDAVRNSVEKI